MNYKLSVTLLFFSLACVSSQRGRKTGKCSYFGEPHLLPFPTAPGQSQNQYICHPNAPEVLVKNKFLEITVTTSSSGNYPIIAYSLVIYRVGGYPSQCVITDTAANPLSSISCPATSPATATLSGQFLHIQHLTKNITIDIHNYGWYIDIDVYQPFNIIGSSSGICINSNCQLEMSNVNGRKKRGTIADSDITAICDAFVRAAAKLAENDVDPFVVTSRRTACIYDISMTGNIGYARGVGSAILRSSIEQNEDDSNYAEQLFKADAIAEQSFCQTIETANQIMAKPSRPCNSDQNGKPCLQPINPSKLCIAR